MCGLSGLTAPLPAAKEHRTGRESATTLLRSSEVTTVLERPHRGRRVQIFLRVPSTASGMSGLSGMTALSAVPGELSLVGEHLNPHCTVELLARDREKSLSSVTLRSAPVRKLFLCCTTIPLLSISFFFVRRPMC